ncbi:SUN domain-containing protein 5-like isoform X2 [Archocentrus centrarchus]|uniref:SUN domain-containing protein 5-like isoform X2 n=1 Tax=Archocentrus centrarchus TaxID=63155 RepID=UPI0011E9B481|nr:SUN domain-containing protein 5-like isoform X2 [Archocentrus centrarchus]
MLRRSRRLQENGYYGSDGKPVICYNERTNRVFKKLKGFSKTHARYDTLPDTYLDVPLDVPSGTRSSETSPANRPWKMLAFILFLCLGLFVTLAFRTEFSTNTVTNVSSGNSEDVWKHLKEPREEVLERQEEVEELQEEVEERQEKLEERYEKLEDLQEELEERQEKLEELQEEVEELHEELEELQEGLEEHQDKLKERQEEVTDLQEELEELKFKMEFLHPVSDRMPNFALESLGARIITDTLTEFYPREDIQFTLFGHPVVSPKFPPPMNPGILLQGLAPTTPGYCWAFRGNRGGVLLELSHNITISHVTMGYISKNISPDETLSSAPRIFTVLARNRMMKFLTLWIHNNWGNRRSTCVYSFRVHGKVTDSKDVLIVDYL